VQPNILLIIADQHRWDAMGTSRRFCINTPNIDGLARDGAFFEHAFTPCPVCAPARQSLLSGLAPDSFGALWNNDFIPTPTVRPDDGYFTAALGRSGYRCGLIGKWNSSTEFPPSAFGFSDHIGFEEYNKLLSTHYPALTYRNQWFGEPSPVALEDSKTHWMARQACGLMDQYTTQGKPWMVRVDFTDPHLPCRPSQPFASMYDPDALEPWDSFGDTLEGKPYIQRQQLVNWGLEGLKWEDWKTSVAQYYGMVSQIDDAVGIMLGKLASLGQADDTIVIYTSDHGDLGGGHGMLDKHYVLYDDVTRVPFIIRHPPSAKAGVRVGEYVSNCLDLGATIGDLCAVEVNPGHGRSLAPLLRGELQPERDFSVSSSNGQQFGLYTQRCIRTADWLYVWNLTDVDELYSVPADPGQKHNLISDAALADTVADLRRHLHGELIRRNDPFAQTGWLDCQLLEGKKG
jgi:arylsulfatase A-like enzyme